MSIDFTRLISGLIDHAVSVDIFAITIHGATAVFQIAESYSFITTRGIACKLLCKKLPGISIKILNKEVRTS